eukprot:TRINITY_DN123503_c0_g1_i1.p2 TRINITY_DN123503_c0_g1~~TRINITY_DN123503_c0_g1_i1.p2  ORF type:complete len:181 (+),score=47.35 TRINITY_DN123503_c0_g1_i1:82-624(+)
MGDSGKIIFVTVGTTSFEALIQAVDTADFHKMAWELGFRKLVVQYGRGAHKPTLGAAAQQASGAGAQMLQVDSYAFKPSLEDDFDAAALVISHAGAGSIVEALRAGRRLLVVVNPSLMDNHQLEIAEAMADQGYCSMATEPGELLERLPAACQLQLQPYPAADLGRFYGALEAACGVPTK